MSDLQDLYQEVVIDHGRRPRNFYAMADATHSAEGYNPLCGDRLNLYLSVADGIITDASFKGAGCAISTASASLMTDLLKGKSPQQADEVFAHFHRLLTEDDAPVDNDILGKLSVLAGVRDYPTRVKCATLAWHTLQAALEKRSEPVVTE